MNRKISMALAFQAHYQNQSRKHGVNVGYYRDQIQQIKGTGKPGIEGVLKEFQSREVAERALQAEMDRSQSAWENRASKAIAERDATESAAQKRYRNELAAHSALLLRTTKRRAEATSRLAELSVSLSALKESDIEARAIAELEGANRG